MYTYHSCRIRAGWVVHLWALLSLPCACVAFPTFPALIPNGLRVPCPSHFDETQSAEQCALDICKGVGHVDCRGGDFPDAEGEVFNDFGKSFQAAGRQWTTELCNEDSDGDGKTNGQELGDPCCVWRPSALSTVGEDYRISHPGHAEDVTDSNGPTPAECQALQESLGAATAFDLDEFVDGLYNPGEDRLNMTFRVQEHTLLPNETVYTEVFFPLELEQDVYVVGFAADVRNAVHLHHFVVYLCTQDFDQLYERPRNAGFPQQPPNEERNGRQMEFCQQNLYNWAPGGDTIELPKNMAIKVEKEGGYKAIYMQIHYNNPNGDTDATDSSAFTAYATSKPRDHNLAVWWSGSLLRIGDIPPGRAAYFNSGECRVRLVAACSEIQVVAQAPHAHFLGTSIWTELYRPDDFGALTYVGDISREDAFNYELQRVSFLPEEVTVREGDIITTTCVFDSMDRTQATPGGLASSQEMCVNFLTVYPAECLPRSECITISRAVSGDVPQGIDPPYHGPDLYAIGGSANFSAVAAAGLATCDAAAVFTSTVLSPSAPILEQVLSSFAEACPGTLDVGEQDILTPQEALSYECRPECVEWLINLGVCISTDLKAQYELLTSSPGGDFLDPSLLAPPACHDAVARSLTERSGGTFVRPEVPRDTDSSAAASVTPAPHAVLSAQTLAMAAAYLFAVL